MSTGITEQSPKVIGSHDLAAVQAWADVVGLRQGLVRSVWSQCELEDAKFKAFTAAERAVYLQSQEFAVLVNQGFQLTAQARAKAQQLLDRGRSTAYGQALAESDVARTAWLRWTLSHDCAEHYVIKQERRP